MTSPWAVSRPPRSAASASRRSGERPAEHGALTGAGEALRDQPACIARGSEDDDTTGHRA